MNESLTPVDLLAFGPHPDDIEIGIGGTVAKHAALGFTVGLCDLSAGEMGSNGTVAERAIEADAARAVLGAAWRTNLHLPDRAIGSSPDHARAAVELVRYVRPRVVLVQYWSDRHPDHVSASKMLTEAVFDAGLRRYPMKGEAWKPESVCYYFINEIAAPSFVVDVSDQYETKRQALACYVSQFNPISADAVRTRLTSSHFPQMIQSRDALFGAQVSAAFAEGFVVRQPVVRAHLFREGERR